MPPVHHQQLLGLKWQFGRQALLSPPAVASLTLTVEWPEVVAQVTLVYHVADKARRRMPDEQTIVQCRGFLAEDCASQPGESAEL